jgi:predicted porin
MKKTLIAAGIAAAVAAPAAFADVKISGVVEQSFQNVDAVSSSAVTDDWSGSADNSITFKASEDLGNGMTAFASITLDVDGQTEDNNSNTATKDEVVGIKGSFGTVQIGRFEDFTEGKLMSRMTLTGDGNAAGGAVENGTGSSNAGRTNNGIAYVSPTMNGFHVGVGGFMIDDSPDDTELNTDNADTFDATDIALFYDNGPLSVAVSQERIKHDTNTIKTTVMTASYTLGDLKASVLRTDAENQGGTATNDSNDMIYRLDYKMGNNTLTVAYNDDETAAGADTYDIWSAEVVHNFSKQTAIYANYTDYDGASAKVAGYGTAEAVDSVFSLGMIHKF